MDNQNAENQNGENQIVDVTPAPASEAEQPQAAPEVTEAPASEAAPEPEAQSTGADTAATPVKPDAQPEPPKDGNLPAPAVPAGHKAGGPIAAVIAAIVVAVGLAAVTVYAYFKTQNDNKPSTSETAPAAQAEPSAADEVDDTTKEVDQAIEDADGSEFDEAELSDESLGL